MVLGLLNLSYKIYLSQSGISPKTKPCLKSFCCEWKGLSHVTSWFEEPVVGGTAWLKKETDTWIIINTSRTRKKQKFLPLRYSSYASRKSAHLSQSPERSECGRDVIKRCLRAETGIETSFFHCFAFLPVTLAQTDPRGYQSG